ncbi:polyprenyl diphosphate synthase [Candidatus Cytomitobacter primus]|uniref:Isoprenyl transferase n=1 Tax=Candidatus Cytomitobacter primus TaxID=2066024 RepID=A0A5C0UE95_9PROT|nr:polyprenyl diphosphate synthase [Candidatus Cytomitobacter primus]QEK38358.1 di-trans,poly-cis-decaprenylcistransferase [Candidatus Cytomitobacter primus]
MTKSLKHIAFIMDGNRRWAKANRLNARQGHETGLKNMMKIIKYCDLMNLKYASFYTFSQENWFRNIKEIYGIFYLIDNYGDKMIEEWKESNVNVRIIGDKYNLPYKVKNWIDKVIDSTQKCTGLNVSLVVNYSGRQEIIHAVNQILQNAEKKVDSKVLQKYLYTNGMPDPDLCIRTGYESRLSNFFLWQIAYTEIEFADVLWPDFSEEILGNIIAKYNKKDRRFGM